jgi:DNA-binding beta-propeller fold protein YncE
MIFTASAKRTLLAIIAAYGCVGAQTLYWVDATFYTPRLASVSAAGGTVQSIALVPGSLPLGLAASTSSGNLYLTELAYQNAHVKSVSLALADSISVNTGLSSLRGIAIDEAQGLMYWTSTNLTTGPQIHRAALNGSGHVVLQTFPPGSTNVPNGIALDRAAGRLYWADFKAGAIMRADTAPNAPITVAFGGQSGPVGVAIDSAANRIYWTDANANTIAGADMGATTWTTLITGLSRPNYIAIDPQGGRLYWTEIGVPRIQTSRLDGSDVRTVAVAAGHPGGIAVVNANTAARVAMPAVPVCFALSNAGMSSGMALRYAVASERRVTITILDMAGRIVATPVDAVRSPGYYTVSLAHRGLAPRAYVACMRAGEFTAHKRLFVVR